MFFKRKKAVAQRNEFENEFGQPNLRAIHPDQASGPAGKFIQDDLLYVGEDYGFAIALGKWIEPEIGFHSETPILAMRWNGDITYRKPLNPADKQTGKNGRPASNPNWFPLPPFLNEAVLAETSRRTQPGDLEGLLQKYGLQKSD